MKSLARRLKMLRRLTAGHGAFAALLFVIMLAAALAEAFGLSIVLPLLGVLIEPAGDAVLGRLGQAIMAVLPAGTTAFGLLTALIVAFAAKTVLQVLARGLSYRFALSLRADWTEAMFQSFLNSPYGAALAQRQGVVVNNMVQETYGAAKAITNLLDLINRALIASALFVLMLVSQWQITLIVAAIGLAAVLAIRRASYRFATRFGRTRLGLQQEITANVAETVANIRLFKAFDAGPPRRARLRQHLARFTRAETGFIVVSELPYQLTEFLVLLFLAGVLVVSMRVLGLEPAAILPMLGFFAIAAQRLVTYATYIVSRRMKIAANLPALRLIHDAIAQPLGGEDLDTGESFQDLAGDIVLDGARFAHAGKPPVLDGLAMRIEHGTITALIGPSGIGKSTLAGLLLGLYRLDDGSLKLGDRPIEALSLRDLRRKVGYVAQEPEILNASVADNIALGDPSANRAAIEAAARRAHAHDFIAALPDGYDTVLGDRGADLSGGQRQRIAIARVLLRQPAIYIFDEATSALDAESESLIRETLRGLAGAATVLIIAHRDSTIADATTVYRMTGDGKAATVPREAAAALPAAGAD